MSVLELYKIQKAKQNLRVSVEENPFKFELLTHLLPVPVLIAQVREGGVEEKGGNIVTRRDALRGKNRILWTLIF